MSEEITAVKLKSMMREYTGSIDFEKEDLITAFYPLYGSEGMRMFIKETNAQWFADMVGLHQKLPELEEVNKQMGKQTWFVDVNSNGEAVVSYYDFSSGEKKIVAEAEETGFPEGGWYFYVQFCVYAQHLVMFIPSEN